MAKTLEELTAQVEQLQQRVDFLERQLRFSAPVIPTNIVAPAEQNQAASGAHRQTATGHVREQIA